MKLKRISFLFIFFCTICSTSQAINRHFAIQENQVKIDNTLAQLEKLVKAGQLDSAENILKQLYGTHGFSSPDKAKEYQFYKLYNYVLFKKSRFLEAKKIAAIMLELSLDMKDPDMIAGSYYILASSQKKSGELNKAAESITRALKAAENLNNEEEKAKYYFLLSDIFFDLRDTRKSLFYSSKAYGILKDCGNPDLMKAKLTVILSEILSGQLASAERHLREAERNIDPKEQPLIAAKIHLQLGHLYFEKKQYAHAIEQLNQIPQYYKFIDNKSEMQLHTEMSMAESYIELKDYKKAGYYYEKNINQALKEMDVNDLKIILQMGFKIYEALGDSAKTIDYLKKYAAFIDSVSRTSMQKAVQETEIKYQTTLKEKAISDQKLQLINKDLELQKKNRYLIYGFSALFLLLLSALIVYLIYRNRNQAIELSLLKAQIHPHFLFNTLNNLYALSISKSDAAPGVVMSLSSILRYILYECNTLNADLQKEMDIIAEYISLEKIRYGDGLEVNTYFDRDFTGYTVAPLLLLPLVENAYKHGVSKLEKDSWINIEAKLKGDRFVFKISNNKPINKNVLQQKTIYGNIGLKNIKKRLAIIYPKQHKFRITESEDVFIVTLELVAKRKV
ncbi:tetratricopeptide repeat-containing sensor histidine kinase [Pedobacter frigoris]|nr:histidine kinase [Pedobacter frigoris]